MKRYLPYIVIILGGSFLFFHSLGSSPLFDWDEINFAESAREMIVSGDYLRVQINFQPFWEKPPLFFWLQVVSMKIFGINEFAARFPNAVCGIATLLVLYNVGKRLHSKQFGIIWTIAYLATFLPHVYFKSGIIDPWFNLYIFLGIYHLSIFLERMQYGEERRRALILSGLFTGLSILTKGPVGLLIVLLSYAVFIVLNGGKGFVKFSYYLKWLGTVLAVTLIWFGLEVLQHGWWFINEFFTYQVRLAKTEDAGHGGFPFYHFVVLLFGCFPLSIFIFHKKINSDACTKGIIFKKMMWASLVVILFVFSLVKTKIVHYSSFAYFPLVYLAALQVYNIINGKSKWSRVSKYAMLFLISVWTVLLIAIPVMFVNISWLKKLFAADPFATANLGAIVEWNYWLVLPGVILLIGYLTFLIYLRAKKLKQAFLILSFASIITIQLVLTLFVPRIEKYTQHAAIEFYKNLQDKDVYIRVIGYKSYAHYFYASVKQPSQSQAYNLDWLMYGKVDKPVYFVTRLDRKQLVMEKYGSQLKLLYEKNGFLFFERNRY